MSLRFKLGTILSLNFEKTPQKTILLLKIAAKRGSRVYDSAIKASKNKPTKQASQPFNILF